MTILHVGVVGYCPPSRFDEAEAERLVRQAYDKVADRFPDRQIVIVSGLTDVGVLSIAYKEAVKRHWLTVGITSQRALEHPLFPVDDAFIIGENWGDESPTFVSVLDFIIRVGGGKQSRTETDQIRERLGDECVIECDLPLLDA